MDQISGDALVYMQAAVRSDIDVTGTEDAVVGSGEAAVEEFLWERLGSCDLVVDAMLGTGINGDVEGQIATAIGVVNEDDAPVLAIDVPSGVCADTGAVLGCAVRADETVTFGLPKTGLLQHPGAALCGRLVVADIGIPVTVSDAGTPSAILMTPEPIAEIVPRRALDSHKGHAGRVMVVGGSTGMTGAIALAAQAAARTGSGLVHLGVPASLNHILESQVVEPMTVPLPEGQDGHLGPQAERDILGFMRLLRVNALAVGPGLGRVDGAAELVRRLLLGSTAPVVVDADGLWAVAQDPDCIENATAPVIITPHPAELATLMRQEVDEIQADRVGAAREAADRLGAITVLKGARTVIAPPDGPVLINPTGNPGMSSGGMGDVLTGVIVSLLGQGVEPLDAAALGAYLHGLAADLVAEARGGAVGMVASDLLETLPAARARAALGKDLAPDRCYLRTSTWYLCRRVTASLPRLRRWRSLAASSSALGALPPSVASMSTTRASCTRGSCL